MHAGSTQRNFWCWNVLTPFTLFTSQKLRGLHIFLWTAGGAQDFDHWMFVFTMSELCVKATDCNSRCSRYVYPLLPCVGLPGRSRSMTSSASSPMSSSFATRPNKVSTSSSSDLLLRMPWEKLSWQFPLPSPGWWRIRDFRILRSAKLSVRFVGVKRPPRSTQSVTLGNRSVIRCKTQIAASIGTTQKVPSGTQLSAIHNIDQQNARQLAL